MGTSSAFVNIVSEEEHLPGQLVLPSGPLDDATTLRAMATMETETTLPNALRTIVAESMIALEIPHGSRMVPPIIGVILRNIIGDAALCDPRTLVAMRDDLGTARTEQGRFNAGVRLGDRATHMASGWGASRALRRHMGDSELIQYAASNAFSGYDAAIAAAEELRSLSAIAHPIRLIRARLAVVIAILQSLKSDQRKKIQRIIDQKREEWEREARLQPWKSFLPEA